LRLRSFRQRRAPVTLFVLLALLVLSAGCGGDSEAEPTSVAETSRPTQAAGAAASDLSAVKAFLGDHTGRLVGFTEELERLAARYHELAEAEGSNLESLWARRADEVGPLLQELKATWVEGNPYYERVEGIVAGTPSLAEYDVIIDAGSSAAEDPESAVPFDLTLADGTVLEQPGNLFNLTEGALWNTLPEELGRPGTTADLDGDGALEFGEVLPDPALLLAASETFAEYAKELAAAGRAWQPSSSDAFTAMVVMVPTMSEYFGQWKVSRFVAGDAASSEAFNVVSRLSDIRDILTGLEVIYEGIRPAVAEEDEQRAAQTGRELSDLRAFIADLHEREQAGKRFTPEQADTLGTEAQERATAIAGQVSQAAAQLGVAIEQ
jgi:Imelysin